ncbi:MAG TPA: hypothetical protein VKH42_15520 [Vicinamibacterales bacterium]|nr:hypothetical protein [Vicinamibacterales bacterium]
MSTSADSSDLQFDRAEFSQSGQRAPCAMCRQPLSRAYFNVNALTVCATCCQKLRDRLDAGTPVSRALRAAGAGLVAAVLGTILYYGVLAITGYELGLIAIVVGFMVGKAVQWGAYGRGGWKYQTLAMILTYLSIVGSYVPMIVREIGKPKTETSAPARGASTRTPEARPAVATQGAAFFAFGLLALLALACALPFLAGIRNIMGLVIIGIGLYEAWKFNRRRVIEITGPHTLAAA